MPKDKIYEKEGEEVRQIREDLGLTRTQLASRLGISAGTLKNVEIGQQRMGPRTRRDLKTLAQRDEVERQRDAQMGCAEESPHRPSTAAANTVTSIGDLAKAAQAARNQDVVETAKRFAKHTGRTVDEAIAIIVANTLTKNQ